MKHLVTVLLLTLFVSLFSIGVFVIDSITSPIIEQRLIDEANDAKKEVLPELGTDWVAEIPSELELYVDKNIEETSIIDLFSVEGYGYIYQAEFQGYQSKIQYMIGINENGEITGYKTLAQGDTPGLGAEIANPDNWEQFTGMNLSSVSSGDIDGFSGATITSDAWKASLSKVVEFHNNVVLGFVYTDVTNDFNLPSAITKIEVVSKDDVDLHVIYTAVFESSFSSNPNIYQVTIDMATGDVKKLQIIEATDSEDMGFHISDVEFAEQFSNMIQQDALDGNYDDLGGATYPITLAAFTESFEDLIMFHKVEFEDYVPPVESFEDKLIRWHEELSVEGATFTDVTADFDLTDTTISKVEVANDGTKDVSVIFTFIFDGYNQGITAYVGIDLETNKLTGFRVLSQSETDGLGANIALESYWEQFEDMNMLGAQYGVFDGLSGATVTTNALTDAFDKVISFYRVEFNEEVDNSVPDETELQRLQRFIGEIYVGAFSINDVSTLYTLSSGITNVLEISDIDGNFLGYILMSDVIGADWTDDSSIQFMIGMNDDRTFEGFRLIGDTETPLKADPYYLAEYQDQFMGIAMEILDYEIDAVAGSTETHIAIMNALENAAKFFVEEVKNDVWNREAPTVVDDADLLLAFPTGVNFTSIYAENPFNEYIINIYEVDDGTNVIGHIYISEVLGNSASVPIVFAWGVNLAGVTQSIAILENAETWLAATSCGEYCDPLYDGSLGYFPDTSWLTVEFENIILAEVLTVDGIDTVGGVSKTTDAMTVAAEAIATYHELNVGGGS